MKVFSLQSINTYFSDTNGLFYFVLSRVLLRVQGEEAKVRGRRSESVKMTGDTNIASSPSCHRIFELSPSQLRIFCSFAFARLVHCFFARVSFDIRMPNIHMDPEILQEGVERLYLPSATIGNKAAWGRVWEEVCFSNERKQFL